MFGIFKRKKKEPLLEEYKSLKKEQADIDWYIGIEKDTNPKLIERSQEIHKRLRQIELLLPYEKRQNLLKNFI